MKKRMPSKKEFIEICDELYEEFASAEDVCESDRLNGVLISDDPRFMSLKISVSIYSEENGSEGCDHDDCQKRTERAQS